MHNLTMRYPGDPPTTIAEMTCQEFLALNPNRVITVEDVFAGSRIEIPVGDRVNCDGCNRSISPADLLYLLGSRAFCSPCFQEEYAHFCREPRSL